MVVFRYLQPFVCGYFRKFVLSSKYNQRTLYEDKFIAV